MENIITTQNEPAALEPRSIETITTEILYLKSKAGEAILEIGKRLTEAKAQLNHGEWLPWLEEKVGFSTVTAQRFMRLAEEYSNASPVTLLGTSKALQLLALPPSERDEFLEEKHVVDGVEKSAYEMTRKELQEAIRAKQKADADLDELKTKSEKEEKRLRMTINDREAQLEQAKAELERLKNEPKTVTAVETVRDTEAEEKLKKKIDALKKKLEEAESETATYQKVSERAENTNTELKAELERMRKTASISTSQDLAAFKVYFDQAQDAMNRMHESISKIKDSDPEKAKKLAEAVVQLATQARGMFESTLMRMEG